jgi:diguanylate cyclase (GGDEF)-like protein
VSEFYENESRFFLARPLGTSGYIVLKVDTSLIVDYISRTAGDSGTIFAIFDESGRVIGYNGNSGGSLGRSIEDYFRIDAELLDENGRFIRSRHYGSVGTIQGTRWRWIALEPVSNSNTSSWSVFGPALAIATGLGFANLILLLKLSKSMFKPLLPVTRTLERACGSATEEPVFQKLDLDFGGDFGGIVGDLNAILEDTESTLQDAQRSAGDADDFVPASDFLTGLHDRGTFTALLGETLTHSPNAANAAVMFVEVDNFKAVSTEFGHKAGDEMVRFTAEKLHNTVKAISQESFAGRLGGAVFALCITECPDSVANTDSLEQVCTYLDEELQKGYFCPIASTQIRVTTKIGVAVNGKQVDSAATIMAQADEAVYLARKNSGANAGAVSETHELANYHVFRTPEPANPAENIENIIKTETKS